MAAIYKITNIINGKIYVGLTRGDINKRFKGHIAKLNNKKHDSSLLYRAIKKHGKENFKIETIVEGDFNINLLCELERHYIRLYSPVGSVNSYNLSNGGETVNGFTQSEETKLKISRSMKKRCKDPKERERLKSIIKRKHSPETIEKFKNKIVSLETRKKLSESKIGIKLSESHRKATSLGKIGKPLLHFRKPILQFDLQGNFIREWNYVNDAAKDGIYSISSIRKCVSGLRKQHKGSIWKYKEINNG